jgi:hypothetical protein
MCRFTFSQIIQALLLIWVGMENFYLPPGRLKSSSPPSARRTNAPMTVTANIMILLAQNFSSSQEEWQTPVGGWRGGEYRNSKYSTSWVVHLLWLKEPFIPKRSAITSCKARYQGLNLHVNLKVWHNKLCIPGSGFLAIFDTTNY